jgi:hypothetical protein
MLCQRMRTRRAVIALIAEVIAKALQITYKRENNKRKAKARETKMNEWVGLALKHQKSKCVCQDPSETVSMNGGSYFLSAHAQSRTHLVNDALVAQQVAGLNAAKLALVACVRTAK